MKKILTILLMVFCFTFAAAQVTEPEVIDKSFSVFWSIFFPGILSAGLVLFADAKKHFTSPDWSWQVFLLTKIRPFLVTVIGGGLLYFILAYVPLTKPFIEILTGSALTEITVASLFGAAAAIYDGFSKSKELA